MISDNKMELKPCPFCGGHPIFQIISSVPMIGRWIHLTFKIKCQDCGISSPKTYKVDLFFDDDGKFRTSNSVNDIKKAMEDWNKRA